MGEREAEEWKSEMRRAHLATAGFGAGRGPESTEGRRPLEASGTAGSPQILQKEPQSCQHLAFSPGRLILASGLQNSEMMHLDCLRP